MVAYSNSVQSVPVFLRKVCFRLNVNVNLVIRKSLLCILLYFIYMESRTTILLFHCFPEKDCFGVLYFKNNKCILKYTFSYLVHFPFAVIIIASIWVSMLSIMLLITCGCPPAYLRRLVCPMEKNLLSNCVDQYK